MSEQDHAAQIGGAVKKWGLTILSVTLTLNIGAVVSVKHITNHNTKIIEEAISRPDTIYVEPAFDIGVPVYMSRLGVSRADLWAKWGESQSGSEIDRKRGGVKKR